MKTIHVDIEFTIENDMDPSELGKRLFTSLVNNEVSRVDEHFTSVDGYTYYPI